MNSQSKRRAWRAFFTHPGPPHIKSSSGGVGSSRLATPGNFPSVPNSLLVYMLGAVKDE